MSNVSNEELQHIVNFKGSMSASIVLAEFCVAAALRFWIFNASFAGSNGIPGWKQ
jgi:hypothetical protein